MLYLCQCSILQVVHRLQREEIFIDCAYITVTLGLKCLASKRHPLETMQWTLLLPSLHKTHFEL